MQEFNPLYLHPYKYNQWSKVPRGPAAVAVGSFLFGTTATAFTVGATAITWGTIGGFLITTAVTSWALSALAPKPEVPVRSSLGNVKEATGPFDIVYGEVRKGGVITFLESSDRVSNGNTYKDDYLHMIIVLAGHEVADITDVYLDDKKVTIDADGWVREDRWDVGGNPLIRIKKYLGTANQLADPDLVTETSVDNTFRGRGIAYLYVRLDWDKSVFSDGIPVVTAQVKGKKVWDPRDSTFKWSDNAALCIRDYLSEEYGVNSKQSPTSLQSPSWNVGANVCDTLVTLKNGSTEKRYTLNGILSTANSPRTNLQKMLTTCGGTLFWGQGQWQFKPGYLPAAPYINFNEDDLRSGIDVVTKNSRKENFNEVTGVFPNKNRKYIEMEYPKVKSPIFLARDNGQTNVLDMPLPLTVSPATAQRLAKMALFRSREEIIIGADFGLKAANVKVGDVIQFNFARYGFVNKLFEVISWKPVVDNGGELKISLVLKETSAAAYSWNAEENDILEGDTVLPLPGAGLAITGLTVTNRQTLQSDGTFLGEVVLSWNRAESAFISRYNVQWKKVTDTSWSATTTEEESIILPSVVSGVAYNFRVQAVSNAGFLGAWSQIGATLPGKNTPPGVPTSFVAKNKYRSVELTWVNPTDRDLNRIEIFTNTTNSTTGATKVGESGGTKFIYDMEPAQSRWFFIRAVDHSENRSAFTTGRQGTALFIENTDVNINVGDLLDDAGLSAVEVLNALPTTGNYNGRTVYLTTDQQLYIHNGTSWERAVKTQNDILTSFNFPSNLRPVEVVSSLPTAGNFNGRIVYLSTDGKMYRFTNQWVSAVPATDVTGQLTNAQIAALDSAKLTGQIVGTQISDNAISTPKILAGSVSTASLAANAVIADKIAANAVTTAKIAANAVTANEILAGSITAGKIAANAVTAGAIEAGAITSDKIQANAILASKIFVTDQNNLVVEGDFSENGVNWNKQGGGVFSVLDIASTNISKYMMRITADPNTNTGFSGAISKLFNVVSGRDYHLGANIFSNGAHSSLFRMNWYDANRNYIGAFVASANQNYGWGYVNRNITAPATAAYGAVALYFENSNAPGTYIQWANVVARPAASAELIVDGAITATKLTTNSVTAGVIAAGAVNAAAIEAGAVTANKINVNNLSAISANLGTITGGSININNNFIVRTDGTAVIRSGTTGERLVIESNRISVYDSSGTLRVRMGEL